jgi:hypothetical protein
MMWLFIILVAVLIGVAIAAGWLAPTRGFGTRIAGVLLALALMIIIMSLIWQDAVLALAISTVCVLAVGVMFQKVTPGKAIGGAIGAFILLFAFVWLARQLAGPFLFNKESDLSRWFSESFKNHSLSETRSVYRPGVFVALGAATLLVPKFLGGWLRALAVFLGALLIFVFFPAAMERAGFCWDNFSHPRDPVLQLAMLCAGFITLLGIIRIIMNSKNHNNNNP